jgi:predicted transcriptional regulator
LNVQDDTPTALGADVKARVDAIIHTTDRQRYATENDQEGIRFVAEGRPVYLHGGAA